MDTLANIYALLIGIDAYEAPDIRDLQTARSDVLRMQRVIEQRFVA